MFRSSVLLSLLVSSLNGAAIRHVAGRLPLVFEENRGQASADVRFLVRGAPAYLSTDSFVVTPDRIAFRFLGVTNPAPVIEPEGAVPVPVNVLRGADPERWRRNIPTAVSVVYRRIYDGVEPAFVSTADGLKLQLRIAANATLQGVAFEVMGARSVAVNADGSLSLGGSVVPHRVGRPDAWQVIGGQRISVEARFLVEGNRVALAVGDYNRAEPLTIESKLPATGSLLPYATAAATDSAGNMFLTSTVSAVPTEPRPANVCALGDVGNFSLCGDAVVLKLDATGKPVWVTYLQGGNHDAPQSLRVDAEGNVYAAGTTFSSDFPITPGAYQTVNAGPVDIVQRRNLFFGGDMFVTRLDGQSGIPIYSTFVGGSQSEIVRDFVVDTRGVSFLLAGSQPGLPTTPQAWKREHEDYGDSAVIGVDPSGARLSFGTYVPGDHHAIAVASGSTVVIAGSGYSDLPVTPNAVQKEYRGYGDVYLVHLDRDGSRPLLATFWGGTDVDGVGAIAVDSNDVVWLTGTKYLRRLGLRQGRILGVERSHEGSLLPLPDLSGGFVLAGSVPEPNLLSSADAILRGGCGYFSHPRLSRFDRNGELQWTSYIKQPAEASAVAPGGDLLFFSTDGIHRLEWSAPIAIDLSCVTNAADRGNTASVSPGEIVTLLGSQIGPEIPHTAEPVANRYPASLGETRVLFDGLPAPLLYADSGQINAVVPWLVQGPRVKIEIERGGRIALLNDVTVSPSEFALFTLDGTGYGQAAALNEDASVNTAGNPATWGSIIVLYGTGGGPLTPAPQDGARAPVPAENRPALPFQVGPFPCEPLYVGPAPGLVYGLFQINCRLPDRPEEFDGSTVPISVMVDRRGRSGPGVTIAVR
jgi:uncharacterized protein (TIGR03437 family)